MTGSNWGAVHCRKWKWANATTRNRWKWWAAEPAWSTLCIEKKEAHRTKRSVDSLASKRLIFNQQVTPPNIVTSRCRNAEVYWILSVQDSDLLQAFRALYKDVIHRSQTETRTKWCLKISRIIIFLLFEIFWEISKNPQSFHQFFVLPSA